MKIYAAWTSLTMYDTLKWKQITLVQKCISGLISKAVKTYFDRKAVKTRLKPVKTGLNRSKRGQNLKLRNTCQGLWKNPVRWIYIYPSVYGLCIWITENLLCVKKRKNIGLLSALMSKWNFKVLMQFNTKCHHTIDALTVTWLISNRQYLFNCNKIIRYLV